MSDGVFYPREHFLPDKFQYSFLPFRFDRRENGDCFVSNEIGEFAILSAREFKAFLDHTLDPMGLLYAELKAKHLLTDNSSSGLFDLLASKYRTKKSFLDGFVKLHIFVLTLRCNQRCSYCQVTPQGQLAVAFDMTEEVLHKSIDLMLCSPAPNVTMEFQGGEPLLRFDLIKEGIRYTKEHNTGKDIGFVVCTNLGLLEDEHLAFFKDHNVHVSSSLDGPAHLHDKQRTMGGKPTHAVATRNIHRVQEALGRGEISCLMTTTRESLQYPRQIIDEYLRMGLTTIFLRDLNPYGHAVKAFEAIGYSSEEFLCFYKEALAYIIELNRDGITFSEALTTLVLNKICTPWPVGFVDLQSPSGAGLGVVVYNYDGDIYASDESRMLAEMGRPHFRLGNAIEDSFDSVFFGETMQLIASASCNEALAGCSDCAYQAYCGADPIRHYSTQGDIFGHRPTSGFCKKNMGVIKHVIDLLTHADADLERVLWAWITRRNVEQMHLPEPTWLSR